MHRSQAGLIPIPIIIALVVSAAIGGVLGYNLGDGTFFSLGFGFGTGLIIYAILFKFGSFVFEPLIKLFGKQEPVKGDDKRLDDEGI